MGSGCGAPMAINPTAHQDSRVQRDSCDVLVIGASASGTCAAVQAARMGLTTILCEPTQWIGGMLTAAGVTAFDGNHRLPSGMFGEFRAALYDHYGGPDAVETGWVSNTLFEPWVGHSILRGWIAGCATLDVRYGLECVEIVREGSRVAGAVFDAAVPSVRSHGNHDPIRVDARVTILADEYGDAVERAGLSWHTGLESRAQTGEQWAPEVAHPLPQDVTWAATIRTPPSGFAVESSGPVFASGDELEHVLGDPPVSWDRFLDYGRLPNDYVMLNYPTHDYGGDYLDRTNRQAVLRGARERTERLVHTLLGAFGPDVIGLPDVYPGYMAAIPYIREARRINAVETLSLTDLTNPRASLSLRNSIAVGDYPVDHHRSHDPDAPAIEFPKVCAFGVPYGTMVPSDLDGVLVAEKSIGVTGLVNGCTRLQPVVMQIGQAAGLAAHLCVTRGIEPRAVPVDLLQDLLLERGGMLVPAYDVPPDHQRFTQLQRDAVHGERPLRYESEGWANRAYLDP